MHFSPDGKRIAAVYSDSKEPAGPRRFARRVDPPLGRREGKELADDRRTQRRRSRTIVFSPDGKRLAAGADFDGVVHLWDVETGKELSRLGEQQGVVCSAAFSPDGRTALTGCMDGFVRVWDTDRGALTRRVEVGGGRYPSYQVSFSGDRKTAAVSGIQNVVGIWDLDSGKKKTELGGGGRVVEGRPVTGREDAGFSRHGVGPAAVGRGRRQAGARSERAPTVSAISPSRPTARHSSPRSSESSPGVPGRLKCAFGTWPAARKPANGPRGLTEGLSPSSFHRTGGGSR